MYKNKTRQRDRCLLVFEVVRYLADFPEHLHQQHQQRVVDPCVQLVITLHCASFSVPEKRQQDSHPSIFKFKIADRIKERR